MDSGAGGLTVLTAIRKRVPDVDVIYFADTAHVPYGDRPLEEIARLGAATSRHLQNFSPAAMVVASGSTCAAFDACGWPLDNPNMIGVADAGAREAVAASVRGAIAVIATTATVRGQIFDRAITALAPGARVIGVPAPALVPIVEAGESDSERARRAVAIVCRPVLAAHCDAVILGCTHFPHLQKWFAQALPLGVAIVDPAIGVAEEVAELLEPLPPGSGLLEVDVTGDERDFAANAARLSGVQIDSLRHVELSTTPTPL